MQHVPDTANHRGPALDCRTVCIEESILWQAAGGTPAPAKLLLNYSVHRLRAALVALSRRSDKAVSSSDPVLWPALTRYVDDGHIEIDNSAVEQRSAVALQRRSYLFSDAGSGGERVAACARLIGTARLNGIVPKTDRTHVLTHIADHPAKRVDDRPS